MGESCEALRCLLSAVIPAQAIRGADAIAEHIFGDRKSRRKIYYLAECSKIPIFRLGSTLCLRPAAYERWIKDQEERAAIDAKRDV